jgi:hypothetical protein
LRGSQESLRTDRENAFQEGVRAGAVGYGEGGGALRAVGEDWVRGKGGIWTQKNCPAGTDNRRGRRKENFKEDRFFLLHDGRNVKCFFFIVQGENEG